MFVVCWRPGNCLFVQTSRSCERSFLRVPLIGFTGIRMDLLAGPRPPPPPPPQSQAECGSSLRSVAELRMQQSSSGLEANAAVFTNLQRLRPRRRQTSLFLFLNA